MKAILLALLFVSSCAHKTGPTWVEGIRSGEERLMVQNGNKLLFRRIAGAGEKPDQACQKAIFAAEQDIRLNDLQDYSVEVLYYDEEHKDCAVTLSVNPLKRADMSVRDKVMEKIDLAEKYAITGIQMSEFEQLTKVRVPMLDIDFRNECWANFHKSGASYHGHLTICWRQGSIVGYCKNGACTSRP